MGVFSIGKVLVDSLFKKPATLMYPVIPREWEEMTRGAVGIDIEGCVLCGMCQRACPTNAITVDRKAATWSIERMNCVQCRGCVDSCPPNCLIMEQKYTEPGVEKVVDTFDIPKKEKPKKEAPAKDDAKATEEKAAPAKEEPKAAAPAEEAKAAPAAESGLVCDVDSCVFCGACAEACPVDAIEVGDSSWKVDKDTCIECGACVDACPADCLSLSSGEAEASDAPAADEKTDAAEDKKAEETSGSKSEPKVEQTKTLREAMEMDDETKEKVEGYVAQVKDALVNEFKMAEDAAEKLIKDENLKGQLARFPYMLKKAARDTAERLK